MIESGFTPPFYVWLDHDADYPPLFSDANGVVMRAPIFFEGDTRRLVAGREDVLITITKDVYKIVTQLKPLTFAREV